MLTSLILLGALIGIILNMSFAGLLLQPDWSLALLLAVLLCRYQEAYWVLPSIWFHDVILFWSSWVTLPYVMTIWILLFYMDTRLGPGQQQRWVAVVLGCMPLWFSGVDVWSCCLTMALCVCFWFILSPQRDKAYVEPA